MVISVNRKDARIGKFPACLKFFWAMRKLKIKDKTKCSTHYEINYNQIKGFKEFFNLPSEIKI